MPCPVLGVYAVLFPSACQDGKRMGCSVCTIYCSLGNAGKGKA